jgi:hypothetical protein
MELGMAGEEGEIQPIVIFTTKSNSNFDEPFYVAIVSIRVKVFLLN